MEKDGDSQQFLVFGKEEKGSHDSKRILYHLWVFRYRIEAAVFQDHATHQKAMKMFGKILNRALPVHIGERTYKSGESNFFVQCFKKEDGKRRKSKKLLRTRLRWEARSFWRRLFSVVGVVSDASRWK